MNTTWATITSFANLCRAAQNAARGKRSVQGAARFLAQLELEALQLQRELVEQSWRPGRAVTFDIRDPKVRTITAAPFRDRVVHHALIDVLEPGLDAALLQCTFACRRGYGQHRALQAAQRLVRRHGWFLKLDVAKFFPSLRHDVVLEALRPLVSEPDVLALCETIVRGGGMDRCGLPIGNLTSQWFANLVLGQMDRWLVEQGGVPGYVRYMDDFVLFGDDKATLRSWHSEVTGWLAARGMALKERATLLAPVTQGLPFLGFRIYRGLLRLRPENARRTKARWRRRQWQHRQGALDEARLADCMRAVLAHLDHGNTFALRRAWFAKDTAADRSLRQPRQPRRELQQPRSERAVGQPPPRVAQRREAPVACQGPAELALGECDGNNNAPSIRNNNLGLRPAKTSHCQNARIASRHARTVRRDVQIRCRCRRGVLRRPNRSRRAGVVGGSPQIPGAASSWLAPSESAIAGPPFARPVDRRRCHARRPHEARVQRRRDPGPCRS